MAAELIEAVGRFYQSARSLPTLPHSAGQGRKPLRQRLTDFVWRIFLNEVQTSDGHLSGIWPATAEVALVVRECAWVSIDEKLGHGIRGEPLAILPHDFDDAGGFTLDGPLSRPGEGRTPRLARFPKRTTIRFHF